jgi:hypothetical protein
MVKAAAAGLANSAALHAQSGSAGASALGRMPVARVVIDVDGADEDFKRLIRKMVRVDGRGSVQTAFG